MEIDLVGMRAEAEILLERLDGTPQWPDLRAIHMDVAPLLGRLQGAVGARRRELGDTPQVREAETALEGVKASSRQVGADIRLASEDALALGLRTTIDGALEVIGLLERSLA